MLPPYNPKQYLHGDKLFSSFFFGFFVNLGLGDRLYALSTGYRDGCRDIVVVY